MLRLCIILIMLSAIGCSTPQKRADDLVESIRYVRDPNTGLCFASVDRGGAYGLGLAHVSCDAIPQKYMRELLSE